MKKQLLGLLLVLSMLLSCTAFAEKAPMTQTYSPANVPEEVYTEPYFESQYATVYAPWIRLFHLGSKAQVDQGLYLGEACQQVRSAAQSPINPEIMYFVTNTSGIWISKNNGESWYNCTNNGGGGDAQGLVCDLFDEATVYVQMPCVGVQRSRNYGRTWEKIIEDNERDVTRGHHSNTLALDSQGNLYMALSHGVYKMDYKTEEVTRLWPANGEELRAVPRAWDIKVTKDGKNIYFTQVADTLPRGIWASHDGGVTWKLELAETEETAHSVYSLTFHPENENEIYFTASVTGKKDESKSISCALYRTTPEFQDIEFLTHHRYENLAEGVQKKLVNFYGLQFGPKNPDGIYPLYYCATNSTYPLCVSYDYGKTFRSLLNENNVPYKSVRYEGVSGRNTGYLFKQFIVDYTVPEGRVIHFEEGPGEWLAATDESRWLSSGFSGASIYQTLFSATGKIFFPTTDVGAFIQEENSPNYSADTYPTFRAYEQDSEPHKFFMATYDPNDDNHILVWIGNANGTDTYFGIRQSYDGGLTFDAPGDDRKMPVDEVVAKHYLRNTRILEYDSWDPNTIYTTYWTSYDNGETWQPNEYYYLAVSKTTKGKILGMKGQAKESELYLSEDGGKTWRYLCKPGTGGNFLQSIFDAADDRYVWYTEKKNLLRLDTQSGTFTSYKEKMPLYSAFKYIAQNPKDHNHILVTPYTKTWNNKYHDDPKLWETRDGGQSWHAVPGLTSLEVHIPTFSPVTDEVFIGSMSGMYIYKYKEFWDYLDRKITIEIDGEIKSFSEMPVIENGRAMVPMRELFEYLGATVTYNEQTGEISAYKEGNYITMAAGSTKATLNGKEVTLDAAPYITKKGKTMIPIRFAAEALDINVGWHEKDRIVGVYS